MDIRKSINILNESDTMQKYIPGVPGQIIAKQGDYVLTLSIDEPKDANKHEYEVYDTHDDGAEFVANLNMPYIRPNEAIAAFRKKYNTATGSESNMQSTGFDQVTEEIYNLVKKLKTIQEFDRSALASKTLIENLRGLANRLENNVSRRPKK